MGQRSVDRPRRVSTALKAELRNGGSRGMGEGYGVDWMFAFGVVPSERAAITS